ncbi:MAG TPA: Holliday junction branch migration protein RuvA, partial [Gammaproteobacteria bacterium]
VRLPGVGKKTAERLLVEMRDRLSDLQSDGGLPVAMATPLAPSARDEERDALSALVALGYKPQEASRLISGVESAGLSSEQIIRAALKQAVKR